MPKQILCEVNDGSFLSEAKSKSTKKGVLRELTGPFSVADSKSKNDNRNSRLYSESLLKNRIVESPYTKDMMERGCLFGEADHPSDRLDIRMQEVSHRITEMFLDNEEISGKVEILDTPVGRIVDTLCEVGAKIAISSRAAGSTKDESGKMRVNEDDYIFYTYDLVLNPGFKSAILGPVQESAFTDQLPTLNPDKVNGLIEEIIRTADSSSLSAVETLLNDVDPKVFESSLKKIQERRDNPRSDSQTTQFIVESLKGEVKAERGKVEELSNRVTELTDDNELLKSKLEVTSQDLQESIAVNSHLKNSADYATARSSSVEEKVKVFEGLDFNQLISKKEYDELQTTHSVVLSKLINQPVELVESIIEGLTSPESIVEVLGPLMPVKEVEVIVERVVSAPPEESEVVLESLPPEIEAEVDSPTVVLQTTSQLLDVPEVVETPEEPVINLLIPAETPSLVEKREEISLPENVTLREDFDVQDASRLRRLLSKTSGKN